MKIGFFDSGIGGITVLYQALKILPKEDYLYYADTLHVPYGEKTHDEVRGFVHEAVDFLASQNTKAIVIACNTATSAAINDLRQKHSMPIIGIEPAVKPAIENSLRKNRRVLVLATNLTLKEQKYIALTSQLDNHHIVDNLALPGLVKFAEQFEFSESLVLPYLESQLSAFDLEQYGTVVLGCTHFPFYKDMFRKLLPPHVDIIDGSSGTCGNLKRILTENHRLEDGSGKIEFYQSGTKVEDQQTLNQYMGLFERLRSFDI